jgi:RTX calcium-binding nonapeptide repeat (4 copies)
MKRLNTITLFICLGLLLPMSSAKASPEPPVPAEGCRNVEAGRPGPIGNRLLIDTDAKIGLRREGDAIAVFEPLNPEKPPHVCEGPPATVHSIDRIIYRPPGGGDPPRIAHRLEIDQTNGFMQPGASDEPGGDEIEIYAEFPPEPHDKWTNIFVRGGEMADRMRIGGLGRGRSGVNLDLGRDGRHPDVDLVVAAATDAHFKVIGGGGGDRIEATARGTEFEGPLPQRTLSLIGDDGNDWLVGGGERNLVQGGAGNDVIYGGDGKDRLEGGDGDDRAFGGAGDDEMRGGFDVTAPYSDLLSGGKGRDSLRALDGNADQLTCGAGPDNVWVDGFDGWSRSTCEKPHGPQFN